MNTLQTVVLKAETKMTMLATVSITSLTYHQNL